MDLGRGGLAEGTAEKSESMTLRCIILIDALV